MTEGAGAAVAWEAQPAALLPALPLPPVVHQTRQPIRCASTAHFLQRSSMAATLQVCALQRPASAPRQAAPGLAGRPSRRRRASVVLAAAEQGDQPPQEQRPGGLPPLPPRADSAEDRLWVSFAGGLPCRCIARTVG